MKGKKQIRVLAICMVLLVVLSGIASAAIIFADKVDYRTGRGPYGIYAADFDGDGDIDVVTTNSDSSTFSYFANKGNGTFSEKVDYITAESPQGIYAADFDGDGDIDVVTANSGGLWTGNFSYFANKGDGTFSEKVDYKAGWMPWGIYAADFDGDGNIDVVVTNSLSNTFSYFANKGDGIFSEKVDYITGGFPQGVYAADFDGDGDIDVITANCESRGTFSYFANKGGGTFSAKEDYKTAYSPNSIYATDFDGDGDPDIVTAISRGFSYVENYGGGTFLPGIDYTSLLPGEISTSIYAADFDNDGDNDVVTTHYFLHEEGAFACFANKGDGTFSEPVDYATGGSPLGIYATDFDGDGEIDVVTANSDANAFSYFKNTFSVGLVSNYTTKPPKIDGIIHPGEWTNKIPITLNGYIEPRSTKEGELYVMNDDNNLYIAVVIPDKTELDLDYLLLDFDQGNDHIATDGDEDAMQLLGLGYVDLHWDYTTEWWSEDLNQHGNGVRSYVPSHPGVPGKYRYEFVKPLKSGDIQDMALNLGDTIGFRIEVQDYIVRTKEPYEEWYRYPLNTLDADTSRWDEWADLTIVKAENQPPVVLFMHSPENPVVNQTITFNASSSYDPDGNITNYEWDFGDGEKAEGKIVTHSYSSVGNYTIKLTMRDDDEATNSTAVVIQIHVGIAYTDLETVAKTFVDYLYLLPVLLHTL